MFRHTRPPFWPALVVYLLFIIASSLHPLAGWRPADAFGLQFITAPWPAFVTRTDLATNFLVYVPLGYLLALQFTRPRRRGRAVLYTTLAGLTLSLVLEALQQLVPGRIASNLDVLVNALGTLSGALLTLHHRRLARAVRRARGWRRRWFRPGWGVDLGLAVLLLWGLAQFALLPVPGAGWLELHLRPFDTAPGGLEQLNPAWFVALTLEMAALGAYAASLLRPGRYVSALLLLFLAAFAVKLLAATLLLKLRVVGGVLSLETLAAFLTAFWLLLTPWVSRHRRGVAIGLLAASLLLRGVAGGAWPAASLLNIMGLSKMVAWLWPWLALVTLLLLDGRWRRWRGRHAVAGRKT
ncbi:MAG: VanZ family protein [Tepidimonas taiwanensis]|nr:VanZ family protein [Tepidimonas taiwanensis]